MNNLVVKYICPKKFRGFFFCFHFSNSSNANQKMLMFTFCSYLTQNRGDGLIDDTLLEHCSKGY